MRTESKPALIDEPGSPARFSWKCLVLPALAAIGAGLVGSLLAALMMSFLRLALGIPSPVELFGDHLLKLLPAPRFVDLLVRFSPNPKTAPLGLALLGMVALGTGLGLLYALITMVSLPVQRNRPGTREWLTALAFALGMTLVATILFWGELPQNFYGLPIAWAIFVTILGLLADFGLYALALCLCYRALLPRQRVEGTAALQNDRRRLLARAGVAAWGVGSAAGSVGLIKGLLNNFASYDGMQTFTKNGFIPPITPNSDHYAVTQNVVDPSVNPGLWRLEVTGLVGNPGTYTYDELQNLPSTTRAITLECIANYIGGHLISTAIWQGVTLRSLLEKHGGALPSARYVAFYSVDGYSVSQSLDVALQADALLAWRMNGAGLPMRHGYPLRALIPGRFGEENPKWLTRIELTDHFVGGLYADQDWYNGALHTITRIDRPLGHVPLSSIIDIGGIAFAGNRGIQKVEISTDGGANWNVAKLDPPLSQDAWVFWTWQWHPIMPGTYTLVARATDGTGTLQTATKQGTVPNGATGYHVVTMQVG